MEFIIRLGIPAITAFPGSCDYDLGTWCHNYNITVRWGHVIVISNKAKPIGKLQGSCKLLLLPWFHFVRLYSMVSTHSTHPQHIKYPSKIPLFQTPTFCHMHSHNISCVVWFFINFPGILHFFTTSNNKKQQFHKCFCELGLLCIHCWNVCLSYFQQIEYWKQREGGRKDQLAYL